MSVEGCRRTNDIGHAAQYICVEHQSRVVPWPDQRLSAVSVISVLNALAAIVFSVSKP
ncbi:hypothetical protein ACVWZW_003411 [Bradyrhizobium sp. F1.13.4]